MKTIEEKAWEMLTKLKRQNVSHSLEVFRAALKEQDRDTRHACAEEIAKLQGDCISKILAHATVMNCRGGI
jgi:hypothetical protein